MLDLMVIEHGVTGEDLLKEYPQLGNVPFYPRLPQLLALHLQLDLVDLQFVDEPLRLQFSPGWGASRRSRSQPILRPAAQFGRFRWVSNVLASVLWDDIRISFFHGIWWAESFRHCPYSTADFMFAHTLDH